MSEDEIRSQISAKEDEITKIEEEATSNQILFRIYIENVGNGMLIGNEDTQTSTNIANAK